MKKFNEFKVNEEWESDHHIQDRNLANQSRERKLREENRKNSNKEFMCFWSNGAFDIQEKNQVRILKLSNFTEDMGYDESEINDIDSLSIAESWNSPDYYNYHIVTRIK